MGDGVKVVRAEGDPSRRGRTIGLAFAEEINRSVAFYRRYFERRGLTRERLDPLLQPFLSAATSVLPHEVEAIRGMAEGADVPFVDLFAPNAFEELEPSMPDPAPAATRIERCSAFSVIGPEVTLLGHNEQWLAGDAGCAGVVVEVPGEREGVAIVSPTVASWRPAVGMNAAGAAQAVMSVTASDDGPGVPRVLVSRHALESTDRPDALRRAAVRDRSGGYAYVYAFAGGETFTVETTATRAAVLDGAGAHTNHYLDPELAEVGSPPSAGSMARLERLRALLEERPPRSPEDVMSVLSDHGSTEQAVCTHADPDVGEESEAVVFSMVCDPRAARMWVATGNPCRTRFEQVDLSDVI